MVSVLVRGDRRGHDNFLDAVSSRPQSITAVTTFKTILTHGSDEQQHRAWQRKGPVGELHDPVVHIKANNSRISVFEGKQVKAIAGGVETLYTELLRLASNSGIW
jgi:hypothetical protein